jgi:hypothetical protein
MEDDCAMLFFGAYSVNPGNAERNICCSEPKNERASEGRDSAGCPGTVRGPAGATASIRKFGADSGSCDATPARIRSSPQPRPAGIAPDHNTHGAQQSQG